MKKSKPATLPTVEQFKPKPTVRFELANRFKIPHVDMDEEVTITVRGTVTAMRSDQYGRTLEMTITSIKAKGPSRMTDDMKALRTSRMVD